MFLIQIKNDSGTLIFNNDRELYIAVFDLPAEKSLSVDRVTHAQIDNPTEDCQIKQFCFYKNVISGNISLVIGGQQEDYDITHILVITWLNFTYNKVGITTVKAYYISIFNLQ